MMNNNNDFKTDDELLAQFFSAARQEIPDEGFSKQVMRRLPRRAQCANRVWTSVCFAIGMAIFLLYDGIDEVRRLVNDMVGNVAGFLATVHIDINTLLVPAAALLLVSLVGLYNLVTNQR